MQESKKTGTNQLTWFGFYKRNPVSKSEEILFNLYHQSTQMNWNREALKELQNSSPNPAEIE